MARRKKSNDPLTFIITAFLTLPFILAAAFKLIFKGITSLVSFIGRRSAKSKQNYYQATSDNYSKAQHSEASNHNASYHTSSASYSSTYTSQQNRSTQQSKKEYKSNSSQYDTAPTNRNSLNLYDALRIPEDPEPDFSLAKALSVDYDEDEYTPNEYEDKILFEELNDIAISDSDIEIMGLALYDMLMNNDD